MSLTVRIIRPSSREKENIVGDREIEFRNAGFDVQVGLTKADARWPFAAASLNDRVRELVDAVADPATKILWVGRGGYGASDLLPLLPWDQWKKTPPKMIVGYSDVSALHSAFFTRLGWPGLHGPMPLHESWGKGGERRDIDAAWSVLRGGTPHPIALAGPAQQTDGWLFGGCLSVLTNLIGTPYFPTSLDGAILFLEDVDENGGRVTRAWNQWIQSNVLQGVRAVIWGRLAQVNDPDRAKEKSLVDELTRRTNVPTFSSVEFGHVTPNMPLMIGARAQIANRQLTWQGHLKQGSNT